MGLTLTRWDNGQAFASLLVIEGDKIAFFHISTNDCGSRQELAAFQRACVAQMTREALKEFSREAINRAFESAFEAPGRSRLG